MGQYYKAVLVDKDNKIKFVVPIHHDNGSKLMEHSYVLNDMMQGIENILTEPHKVVWAGDYSDIVDQGDSLYNICDNYPDREIKELIPIPYRYIINHTKKIYIDKMDDDNPDSDWRIHPLSLLTAEGNGQGGGDYFSDLNQDKVGTWARNLIQCSDEKPIDYQKVKIIFRE